LTRSASILNHTYLWLADLLGVVSFFFFFFTGVALDNERRRGSYRRSFWVEMECMIRSVGLAGSALVGSRGELVHTYLPLLMDYLLLIEPFFYLLYILAFDV
jgi:hypothetical protein